MEVEQSCPYGNWQFHAVMMIDVQPKKLSHADYELARPSEKKQQLAYICWSMVQLYVYKSANSAF